MHSRSGKYLSSRLIYNVGSTGGYDRHVPDRYLYEHLPTRSRTLHYPRTSDLGVRLGQRRHDFLVDQRLLSRTRPKALFRLDDIVLGHGSLSGQSRVGEEESDGATNFLWQHVNVLCRRSSMEGVRVGYATLLSRKYLPRPFAMALSKRRGDWWRLCLLSRRRSTDYGNKKDGEQQQQHQAHERAAGPAKHRRYYSHRGSSRNPCRRRPVGGYSFSKFVFWWGPPPPPRHCRTLG
mmetsp:Transcript_11499/g.18072  ORF Transcript_11499/g.18072 Transcript_11499/m.18072 type:complete len:235 (-) Transcript_11499:371-1075(-)